MTPDTDCAGIRIVRVDSSQAEIRPVDNVAQRCHNMSRLQGAGSSFRQEWRVKHEVDVIDQNQPGRLPGQKALKLAGNG
jgi:hypothetical protein